MILSEDNFKQIFAFADRNSRLAKLLYNAALFRIRQVFTGWDKEERTDLKHYYQVDERDIDGYFFYKAASPMAVEEICIMKAKNSGQAATLLESAQSHLSSQKNVFEGYGTDQMALLNNALVGKKGNYVYYMCGADAASWRSAFLALI